MLGIQRVCNLLLDFESELQDVSGHVYRVY